MFAVLIGKHGTRQEIKNVTGIEINPNVVTVKFTDPQGDQFIDREMNTIASIEFHNDGGSLLDNMNTAVSGESLP
jgi:hypothetical protein